MFLCFDFILVRKMFWLRSTLIFISAVVYECHAEQKMECPYNSKNKHLQRIWCKRDPNNQNCCMGFTFRLTDSEVEDGHLKVQDNGEAFTVSMTSLPQGDGVYWCGLKNGSVIIKLAEGELRSPMAVSWSIMRWLFFILLLLSVGSTHLCLNRLKRAK